MALGGREQLAEYSALRRDSELAMQSSRRAVVKAGLWSVPAVTLATSLPALAASIPPQTCPPLEPTKTAWQEPSASLRWVPTKKNLPAGTRTFPGKLVIANDGNAPLPAGTEVKFRARILDLDTRYPTNSPYARVAAVMGADGKPAMLMGAQSGYQSMWTLKCEIPVGYQLTVSLDWAEPEGGYVPDPGQFVAALTINPAAGSFFTVLTPELVSDN